MTAWSLCTSRESTVRRDRPLPKAPAGEPGTSSAIRTHQLPIFINVLISKNVPTPCGLAAGDLELTKRCVHAAPAGLQAPGTHTGPRSPSAEPGLRDEGGEVVPASPSGEGAASASGPGLWASEGSSCVPAVCPTRLPAPLPRLSLHLCLLQGLGCGHPSPGLPLPWIRLELPPDLQVRFQAPGKREQPRFLSLTRGPRALCTGRTWLGGRSEVHPRGPAASPRGPPQRPWGGSPQGWACRSVCGRQPRESL